MELWSEKQAEQSFNADCLCNIKNHFYHLEVVLNIYIFSRKTRAVDTSFLLPLYSAAVLDSGT
jgi:hypothetical protein